MEGHGSHIPVTNIHDALLDARITERDKVKLSNINFKINPLKKEIAENILTRQGATLSSFMRACVDGLIRDYAGESAFKKIESSADDFSDDDLKE